jgi:hypothetical protein
MLEDPLSVVEFDTYGAGGPSENLLTQVGVHTFRRVPSAADRTVRVGKVGLVNSNLTVSHSTSKENAPYTTNRTNIRIDLKKVDTEGRTVVLSGSLLFSVPVGTEFGETDVDLVARLLGGLAFSGHKLTEAEVLNVDNHHQTIKRVAYQGEA